MRRRLSQFCLLVVMFILLTGCVGSNYGHEKTDAASNIITGDAAGIPEKYDPPITITTVLEFYPNERVDRTPQGITPENQKYVEILEKEFGIKLNFLWHATEDQFQQKFDLMIACGQYPDVVSIGADAFEKLSSEGMLANLTHLYDELASKELKQGLNSDGGCAIVNCVRNGRLLAIPLAAANRAMAIPLLWIRNDWLRKVNMDPPGNMEDVIKIARAFTYDDPDGNGLYDTVGLGVVDRLFFSIGDLKGFFNGYHTYPDRWIKDENGQLVPGFIMPEMKLPLLKLREMYKDGLIDKEFAVKDYPKLIEEIADGKIGMLYGEWWLPNWPLQMNLDKDPNADWKCYTLPSNDTEPAKTVIKRVVIEKYNVAFKGCKHPEALIKMLNLAYEMENSKECEEKYGKNANKPEGGYVYNWVPVRVNRIFSISKSLSDINKALRIKDPSNLDVGDFEKYNIAQAYLSGDKSKWGFYFANVDENGGFGKIVEMLRQERVIYDEYTGYPNPVIFENEKILYDEMIETFTSIIMGGSVDEYDKFVNKWRELGGDKVIKEVNEWYVQRN